jgi:hypothetical protein
MRRFSTTNYVTRAVPAIKRDTKPAPTIQLPLRAEPMMGRVRNGFKGRTLLDLPTKNRNALEEKATPSKFSARATGCSLTIKPV